MNVDNQIIYGKVANYAVDKFLVCPVTVNRDEKYEILAKIMQEIIDNQEDKKNKSKLPRKRKKK